jgi:hypothetical protein
MRWRILSAFIFCSVACIAQVKITGNIYDSLTGNPIPGLYFNILRDHDKWIDVNTTDSAGCFTGIIDKAEYSKKSTYQLYVYYDEYNLVRFPLDPEKNAGYKIYLSPNPRYISPGKDMISMNCSCISFGNYEPYEPRSLEELPEEIREKAKQHLLDKAGPVFYPRLYLSGGMLVNLSRLDKIEHYKGKYHWRPYPWYLCFSFSDTSLGIARYSAELVLDEEGNVMEDIELPCIKDSIYKENIISMNEAKEMARCPGYFTDSTYTDFEYDSDHDCFTWKFSTFNKDRKEWTYHNKELILNAHNGNLIAVSEQRGCLFSGYRKVPFGKSYIMLPY